MSKRSWQLFFGIVAAIVCIVDAVWWLSKPGTSAEEKRASRSTAPAAQVASKMPEVEKAPVGETILQGYGAANSSVQQDLALVSHVLENFALLVKGDDPLPLGANEEIAAALRGRNRMRLKFVPETSAIFNAKGQIVDRWGVPLYFHAVSHDRVEIRSAGPDKVMWTLDDVQRESDGTFLSTEGMQAPSLLEESLQHRKGGRK
ncbi:hypothetical protein [Prosthecobacter sp.]|uniref:hypothetical protein n=1 Tax=Prosthecobacter sp. TaxID=1965333 RepID=UPI0037837F67